ncbi:hypothetical protein GIW56_21400 [Pseudomonas gessardii]|uniref:Uncharacterized protein n=1 Tax=Pseudomonas gessardii TaxID=78544 RepID=A0ABS9FAL7_9PSED|nr:hypothetical protein [Pseudomonas gessardii]MCF4979115.1 hypothetical protein [Pseudomonas gessardii]MCF4988798.1 hypothetical protein [Pseudomonas gessardii]MCF5085058.1 hypothetical protein [Pseudomonas gessardii]MCF5096042.1 hypothetical protein [Pseudomonas gessardii]MCF5109390.1 hypothetical protein [Pseudomonas gessardii]
MSLNFPGGLHHLFTNPIPVVPENRSRAKTETQAPAEEARNASSDKRPIALDVEVSALGAHSKHTFTGPAPDQ